MINKSFVRWLLGHPPADHVDVKDKRIEYLEEEIKDYEQSFDLYDGAMKRGLEVWRERNPDHDPNAWPDAATQLAEVMEAYEEMANKLKQLTEKTIYMVVISDSLGVYRREFFGFNDLGLDPWKEAELFAAEFKPCGFIISIDRIYV